MKDDLPRTSQYFVFYCNVFKGPVGWLVWTGTSLKRAPSLTHRQTALLNSACHSSMLPLGTCIHYLLQQRTVGSWHSPPGEGKPEKPPVWAPKPEPWVARFPKDGVVWVARLPKVGAVEAEAKLWGITEQKAVRKPLHCHTLRLCKINVTISS